MFIALCGIVTFHFSAMLTTSTVFAFIGKTGAAAGFSIVYQYTAELFPTVVR